jgi:hypothetical protein
MYKMKAYRENSVCPSVHISTQEPLRQILLKFGMATPLKPPQLWIFKFHTTGNNMEDSETREVEATLALLNIGT